MNFDAITLSAVRDEIRARALGGRVQRVVAPAPDRIALEIYANGATHQLLVHAAHQRARVHFVDDRPPAGTDPPGPLLLLLRKWVRNGRLVDVDQLPYERVLNLTVQSKPRGEVEATRHVLVVEIIGRQSNVMLLDAAGRIRDALRRRPGEGGRRRIWPGEQYRAPPPVAQPSPERVEPADLVARVEPAAPAWRVLVQGVAGVSPTLAREALARAGLHPESDAQSVDDWGDVLDRLRGFFAAAEHGDWRPCLVAAADGWQAFAPYELTFLDAPCRPIDSISEAITRFHADELPARRVDPGAARLAAAIDAAVDRAERRVASLEAAIPDPAEIDELRSAGELILAYAHAIEARAASLEHEGREVALDPTKSPAANAQDYFRRYRDRRTAARDVPKLLRRARLALAFIRQARDDLQRADSPEIVRALEAELRAAGQLPATRKRQRPRAPGRERWMLHDREVLVGRTAAENHHITFRDAAPDDWWLHARGIPGAHVIVRDPGADPDGDLVVAAASIAAHRSAARDDRSVEVDVTRRRHVRPIRRGGPGQVTYRYERTLRVMPRAPSEVGVEFA